MVGMVAPRGLFIMENPHIDWLGARSGSVAALGGAEVYKALGAGDNISYWSDVQDGTPLRRPVRMADAAAAEHREVPAETGSAPGAFRISSGSRQPGAVAGLADAGPDRRPGHSDRPATTPTTPTTPTDADASDDSAAGWQLHGVGVGEPVDGRVRRDGTGHGGLRRRHRLDGPRTLTAGATDHNPPGTPTAVATPARSSSRTWAQWPRGRPVVEFGYQGTDGTGTTTTAPDATDGCQSCVARRSARLLASYS